VSKVAAEQPSWREARRAAARQTIIEAAWSLVGDEGFGGLAMRDLARRAGVTPPTLYAYFDSKHAILDAMFAQGQLEFAARRSSGRPDEPMATLRWFAETFVSFCTENPVRYQLLYQRPVPGFVPSDASYALAARNLEPTRRCLAAVGLAEEAHLDVWTALWAGVVAQQIANEPGGTRWTRHVDTVLDMYLDHYLKPTKRRR